MGGENQDLSSIASTNLCRSKALTVPSREALTTTLPEELKVTPVTADECSENVTKQNPEDVFQSFTYR
jgi:hypothetical protein